jgi:hypothetical protein
MKITGSTDRSLSNQLMKKVITLIFSILFVAYYLNGQDSPIMVTGTYQQSSLKSFISETEQKYPVRFFFEDKTIDNITLTADFHEIPLNQCLETIFKDKRINFQISNNQVVIYSGLSLSDLFPGRESNEEIKEFISPQQKLSRDKLLQLQYRIINIGTPGKNNAKTATLSGYLKDFNNGGPIAGGVAYVSATQQGATSDGKGFYKITLPVGNHVLNFRCVGMEPVMRNINLYSDGRLDVEMEEKVNLLQEAVIIGRGKGNLGQMTGREKIDIQTMKTIPALLGEADVMKSVLILPGVQTVGEGTAGFNVRGGSTDQNLILVDQATIYYPTHFFGNFSAINSEIVDNATLYKGSMPVKYGGRLSSVFEINTMEGNHQKLSGSAGISPLSARVNVDGPLFSKKSAFVTSFRSTYSDWVLNLMKVPELYKSKASFYDVQVKLNLYLNDNNNLLVNFYKSSDKFQLHSDTTYKYNNTLGSLILKHKFNSNLRSSTSLIYSQYDYDIANRYSATESFVLTHKLAELSLNNDFEYVRENGKYDFGADLKYYSVNPGEMIPVDNSNITPVSTLNEHALEYGLYAGIDHNITDRLKIEGGLRLSGLLSFNTGKEYIYAPDLPYTVDNILDTIATDKNSIGETYMNPEVRVSLNYYTGRYSSVKFSYNKTAQYIHMLSNTTAISPTDTWKLSDKFLPPATANQFSVGYFKSLRRDLVNLSAEVYYKLMNNVKQYKAGADLLLNDHIETEVVNGKAKSYGLELSAEKTGGRVYGRIDYTYSRTLIKSVSPYKEDLINEGEYFPANYDKPHNLNILATLKATRRIVFSTNIAYSTGRPITYPIAKYMLDNQVFLQYSKYNQYRIPDYFRTDLSLIVYGSLKKDQRFHSWVTFSLYNLTARKNAYSVYFQSGGGTYDAYQLSIYGTIIPSITYNLRF